MGLLQPLKPVDSGRTRVDSLGNVVFLSYLFKTATSGEIGRLPAPKEQPPRKLSGKRTAW
jgi:hypothetical protein